MAAPLEFTIEINFFLPVGSLGRGITGLFSPIFENSIKKIFLLSGHMQNQGSY